MRSFKNFVAWARGKPNPDRFREAHERLKARKNKAGAALVKDHGAEHPWLMHLAQNHPHTLRRHHTLLRKWIEHGGHHLRRYQRTRHDFAGPTEHAATTDTAPLHTGKQRGFNVHKIGAHTAGSRARMTVHIDNKNAKRDPWVKEQMPKHQQIAQRPSDSPNTMPNPRWHGKDHTKMSEREQDHHHKQYAHEISKNLDDFDKMNKDNRLRKIANGDHGNNVHYGNIFHHTKDAPHPTSNNPEVQHGERHPLAGPQRDRRTVSHEHLSPHHAGMFARHIMNNHEHLEKKIKQVAANKVLMKKGKGQIKTVDQSEDGSVKIKRVDHVAASLHHYGGAGRTHKTHWCVSASGHGSDLSRGHIFHEYGKTRSCTDPTGKDEKDHSHEHQKPTTPMLVAHHKGKVWAMHHGEGGTVRDHEDNAVPFHKLPEKVQHTVANSKHPDVAAWHVGRQAIAMNRGKINAIHVTKDQVKSLAKHGRDAGHTSTSEMSISARTALAGHEDHAHHFVNDSHSGVAADAKTMLRAKGNDKV